MLLIRKLGKLLRGKATGPQVFLAATLGGVLGFVPGSFTAGGFAQAPGLILTLLFLVLVLNANLGVFGVTLLAAKATAFVLLPVSFEIGRLLLDGPTNGVFRSLVNAPVLAWFGLEYYATTGGILLGFVFGASLGVLGGRALVAFRRRMAYLEENSKQYQRLTTNRWARLFTWLLVGGLKGKKSYGEILEQNRRGLPIRISGVALVAVCCVSLWLLQPLLGGALFRNAVHTGLERWNGATVDLADASVDLKAGRVTLEGLAMADPEALDHDVFRARTLQLEIGTGELLMRRLVIDDLTSADASTGEQRRTPGQRIDRPAPPPPPPVEPGSSAQTLEHYLREAEKWKARLSQVSRWLDRLSGPAAPGAEGAVEVAGGAPGEAPSGAVADTADTRIEREIAALGLARVAAAHLIDDTPTLLVRNLTLEGVVAPALGDDLLDIHAKNLSTHPALCQEPLVLSIRARSGRFEFHFTAGAGKAPETRFEYRDLSIDDITSKVLSLDGPAPIRGGSLDLRLSGQLDPNHPSGLWIELPLEVTLRDTTLAVAGMKETHVDNLIVPLGLHGPLAAPRIRFDDGVLADALIAAGKKELADQLRKRADALLSEHAPAILGNVLDGKPPDAVIQAQKDAAQKALDQAKRDAAKKILNTLPGSPFK